MTRGFRPVRALLSRGRLLAAVALFVFALAACGLSDPKEYPLRTCVVCDQSLRRVGEPVIFVHDGYRVKTCSESHHQEFLREDDRYLKKIKEAKFL